MKNKIPNYILSIAGFTFFFTSMFGIFGLPYFGAAVGIMIGLHCVSRDIKSELQEGKSHE